MKRLPCDQGLESHHAYFASLSFGLPVVLAEPIVSTKMSWGKGSADGFSVENAGVTTTNDNNEH